MAVKGARTIAEYAIRKWLTEEGFEMEHFTLTMDGNEGKLTDRNGAGMTLVYEPSRSVYIKEY